ncbi:MAG: autotransporter outer membrane beta-barrel domain-containing protein, partial [Robiginitomaculum sp.]|nr:autotransporter outer membrane beta-barrel domain-containing protein [Robiginitomaculum sp.]
FELGDLTLTNATGSDFTRISGSQYSALMTPIDQGTITIALAANKAVDAAGNGNQAANPVSTVFIDENFVRTRTQRIVNNFIARRADQITINDPNLSNRLLNEGTKGRINGNAELRNVRIAFNGTASGEDANLAKLIGADKAAKVNLWTEASIVSIHGKTAENDLTLVYVGADYRMNKDTLIGVIAQVDWADEKDNIQNFAISGTGWMVGPYVVTRIADKLIFDGRAALGRSNNDISPSQTYTDNFKTSRWLLKGQLTGDLTVNDWRVNPNIAVIYFKETQKAYTDGLGINIPEQTVKLGRVTFGPRFSKSFEQDNNMTLTPSLNVRGVWDFEQAQILNLATGLANGTGKLRARTEVGLAATFSNGTRVSLDGFYDGIGASDFEAYGLKIGVGFPIQ